MDILEVLKIVSATTIIIVMVTASVEVIQKSYYRSVLNRKMHKSNMESIDEIKKELMEQVRRDLRDCSK